MNRLTSLAFMAFLILIAVSTYSQAQTVVLINGQPSQVVLDGKEIKNIVQAQISTYMAQYGQESDEAFSQSIIDMNPTAINSSMALNSKNRMAILLANDAVKDIVKIKLD